ncbi:hypothetical protein [Tenacibaculum halocynthiae]|uniref:hypothetical protein n=1 Tax=Tenacibaculum halocynthiae TaxID=1254437 RepID=UPI003D658BCA
MKSLCNLIVFIGIIILLGFASCNSNDDELPKELTIEDKIELLEKGDWLLKGLEKNVKHTFKSGKRSTFYGIDGVFTTPIPRTFDYYKTNEKLTINYGGSNIKSYEVEFSCENTIVSFFINKEVLQVLYKEGSSYKTCIE